MRIIVRGWGRDLGETEIMNAALGEAETTLGPDNRYHRGKTYLRVNSRYMNQVRISTHAELRLGGSYLLHVELSKKEIAKLFYETHDGEMVRIIRSFIEDEDRQEAVRRLARFHELRQQQLAREAEEKPASPEPQEE